MKESEKKFYKSAAKGYASSTVLYGVRSVVLVENKNDIWFWQLVLNHFSFGKVKFNIPPKTKAVTLPKDVRNA